MPFRFTTLALALSMGALAVAQEPSKRGTATATIGGKKVTIDYGRPVLGGRTLDALLQQLPEDRMWRAGKNQVTTLTSETDLTIGDKRVPAGKYSLYVHAPASGDWSLAVNKDLGVPLVKIYAAAPDNLKNEPWPHLQDYQKTIGDKEVARVPMKKAAGSGAPVEPFTIDLVPAGEGATLRMAWGDQTWSVDVKPAK